MPPGEPNGQQLGGKNTGGRGGGVMVGVGVVPAARLAALLLHLPPVKLQLQLLVVVEGRGSWVQGLVEVLLLAQGWALRGGLHPYPLQAWGTFKSLRCARGWCPGSSPCLHSSPLGASSPSP